MVAVRGANEVRKGKIATNVLYVVGFKKKPAKFGCLLTATTTTTTQKTTTMKTHTGR